MPPSPEPARLLDRWRSQREGALALELAGELRPGDLLSVDGALPQPEWPPGLAADLAERCGRRGVLLAGVCKSASATMAGAPALLAARRAALGLRPPWMAPLPGTRSVAACLAPGGRVFRIDLAPGSDPQQVVALAAAWALDAGYLGYPYPLALVHNRCALDEAFVTDLAEALRGAVAARGVEPSAWEDVFGDFHDVLDRGR